MWLDERTEFADNVSVAAGASTALIGDVINMEVARDLGNGQSVYLCIRTGNTEIITGGSAGTIQFKFCSDAQAAIAVDGTATEHIITDAFVTDDVAANSPQLNVGGTLYFGALPLQSFAYEQFLGITCTVASQTVTAGTINAFLTIDPNGWKSYADGAN